ncbi:uncharacterized protein YjbI with pentapeptide repeats [Chitinophaga skermanii]|uniref:Uncharacterized protein YjbI with pentapeptide repeats n=1 Tax=Chitinophaga skermanii TaxID=331697 RepID=A0A327QYE9_9BACT|nr:pentapeptide repeat-containing protein [Chitinophaga skermanii]RAJ08642.1 uncharacterized protein YjbI with pentapeptide repeats [Chitinophaga skermanii]
MEAINIGNKIAKARKQVNMSQAQLAQQLFISPQAVGKWERGESVPDIITMNRLAEILRVDLNYFSGSFATVRSEEVVMMPSSAVSNRPGQQAWDMSKGNWVNADFSGLKNLHEQFSSSNMQKSKFIGSDLPGLLLRNNYISQCDFSASNINNSQFQQSHLVDTKFNECTLQASQFTDSHIKNCDFSGADFTGAKFTSCSFSKNIINHAILTNTSFHDTHFSGIIFYGLIEDCYFENCGFSKVIFQQATLRNTFFKCKSLKNIQFIDSQADRMTYEFLKNGKANVSGLTLLPA